MILVYAGKGKGKTCACVGQAMRALGRNLSVAFAQFLKRDGKAGEQEILRRLLGDDFRAGGLGFFRREEDREKHEREARLLISWAKARESDMIILDEALWALERGLIDVGDLAPLLERRGSLSRHLVLSGRPLPKAIRELADLITEMRDERHYYRAGVPAQAGLEY